MSTQTTPQTRGVQSLHRALDLLEVVATHGGRLPMAEIAAAAGLPQPTVHRLLRTLVERGYVRQLADRRYALGFRLVPLGTSARAVGADAQAVLAGLVTAVGETANLAILSGDRAEYVAQAPSPHAMRMFTEVGRCVELHCTGVGKALLAQLDDERVASIVLSAGLTAHTDRTIATEPVLREALAQIRRRGFALDEQEQELGVRCVAVPVRGSGLAVSISGPTTRMTSEVVERAVPLLRAAASRLAPAATPARGA